MEKDARESRLTLSCMGLRTSLLQSSYDPQPFDSTVEYFKSHPYDENRYAHLTSFQRKQMEPVFSYEISSILPTQMILHNELQEKIAIYANAPMRLRGNMVKRLRRCQRQQMQRINRIFGSSDIDDDLEERTRTMLGAHPRSSVKLHQPVVSQTNAPCTVTRDAPRGWAVEALQNEFCGRSDCLCADKVFSPQPNPLYVHPAAVPAAWMGYMAHPPMGSLSSFCGFHTGVAGRLLLLSRDGVQLNDRPHTLLPAQNRYHQWRARRMAAYWSARARRAQPAVGACPAQPLPGAAQAPPVSPAGVPAGAHAETSSCPRSRSRAASPDRQPSPAPAEPACMEADPAPEPIPEPIPTPAPAPDLWASVMSGLEPASAPAEPAAASEEDEEDAEEDDDEYEFADEDEDEDDSDAGEDGAHSFLTLIATERAAAAEDRAAEVPLRGAAKTRANAQCVRWCGSELDALLHFDAAPDFALGDADDDDDLYAYVEQEHLRLARAGWLHVVPVPYSPVARFAGANGERVLSWTLLAESELAAAVAARALDADGHVAVPPARGPVADALRDSAAEYRARMAAVSARAKPVLARATTLTAQDAVDLGRRAAAVRPVLATATVRAVLRHRTYLRARERGLSRSDASALWRSVCGVNCDASRLTARLDELADEDERRAERPLMELVEESLNGYLLEYLMLAVTHTLAAAGLSLPRLGGRAPLLLA